MTVAVFAAALERKIAAEIIDAAMQGAPMLLVGVLTDRLMRSVVSEEAGFCLSDSGCHYA